MPEDQKNPPFSLAAKKQIARAVRKVLAVPQNGANFIRPAHVDDSGTPCGFWAKITGNHFSSSDTNKFTYSWVEQTEDATGGAFVDLTGGRTGSATGANHGYNTVLSFPCPTNQIVWMIDGADNGTPPVVQYHFCYGHVGGVFPVTVSSDGGSAGSGTAFASWTYTLVWSSNTLVTGKSPTYGRIFKGVTTAGSNGLATVKVNGTYDLYSVDEVFGTKVCA